MSWTVFEMTWIVWGTLSSWVVGRFIFWVAVSRAAPCFCSNNYPSHTVSSDLVQALVGDSVENQSNIMLMCWCFVQRWKSVGETGDFGPPWCLEKQTLSLQYVIWRVSSYVMIISEEFESIAIRLSSLLQLSYSGLSSPPMHRRIFTE